MKRVVVPGYFLQRTLETVQAYKKAAAANKKSLEIKEANFEEGLQFMCDDLNVQRDYFIVRNRYQNARYDYATLMYRFKQLAGDLQPYHDSAAGCLFPNYPIFSTTIVNLSIAGLRCHFKSLSWTISGTIAIIGAGKTIVRRGRFLCY